MRELYNTIRDMATVIRTLASVASNELDRDDPALNIVNDPRIVRSVDLAAGMPIAVACGCTAVQCVPWGRPGACPREAHDHPPCTRPVRHDGLHTWQVDPTDDREVQDPHATQPVRYIMPAPPPVESKVTNGDRVWTHVGYLEGGRALFDEDGPGSEKPLTWPELLADHGPLTLVEDRSIGAWTDRALYGPPGARWGNSRLACPYFADGYACDLGVGHAGPHINEGNPIGETIADGTIADAAISPGEASTVPCSCGHPDSHKPGCARHDRMSHLYTEEPPF